MINGFVVREVRVEAFLGLVPAGLKAQLNLHRGEPYSALRASAYQEEVTQYLSLHQAVESLLAQGDKLVASASLVDLQCVDRIDPKQCTSSFPGQQPLVQQCVDVVLKVYSLDINVLNSSPYLVLLPRSALTKFYAMIPRPLLRLNPSITSVRDEAYGYALGFATTTDLLGLGRSDASNQATHGTDAEPESADGTVPIRDKALEGEVRSPSRATPVPKKSQEVSPEQLLLGLKGLKSVNQRYYNGNVNLKWLNTRPRRALQNISLNASFDADERPQGESTYRRNAALVEFEVDVPTSSDLFQLVKIAGNYNYSNNNLSPGVLPSSEAAVQNSFGSQVVTDGMFWKGLVRSALTVDRGLLNGSSAAYTRATILVGYGKEIPIPPRKNYQRKINVNGTKCIASYAKDPIRAEQTFGLELIAGAGGAWGTVPEYARFFGGSQFTNFLYDDLPSARGPLMRAFGVSQAGVLGPGGVQRGGTSYWHTNLSLSVPIPRWSQPVIPHDWVASRAVTKDDTEALNADVQLGCQVCVDLRGALKTAVSKSGKALLIAQMARDKLTDDEKKALRLEGLDNLTPDQQAKLQAALHKLQTNKDDVRPEVTELFRKDVNPITDFIADHANLFAVKPLFMFDAGQVLAPNAFDDHTRFGLGGGIQIDIVMARFELGYVAALNRIPGDRRGNFVGRLIMKRFF